MEVMTLEGVVDKGQIRLKADVHLPDHTLVYVIVPGVRATGRVHVVSPHLVHRNQATDFVMQVIEADADAAL
jgi:hypothetical protein